MKYRMVNASADKVSGSVGSTRDNMERHRPPVPKERINHETQIVVYVTLLNLVLALSIAPAAHAAPLAKGGTPPALPATAVVVGTKCDAKTGFCATVFQSMPGTPGVNTLTPTTNLYICGVDVYRFGAWYGRLQQNVYGSYGWGLYSNGWKLDSGNLSTSAGTGQWWASLSGPNPSPSWGTIDIYYEVASSGWLMPWAILTWTKAYFRQPIRGIYEREQQAFG
jgi:hypothetical protein